MKRVVKRDGSLKIISLIKLKML